MDIETSKVDIETSKEECARKVRGYTLHMYRLAYSIPNNSTDAEDAVSEAVLHAYEKLRTLRDPDSFKNWILQITANEACSEHRDDLPVEYGGSRCK